MTEVVRSLAYTASPVAPLVPKGAYYKGIKTIEKFIQPVIDRAIALPDSELEDLSLKDENYTFLHSIAQSTKDPKVLRDQIMSVLLAGRDTTAATMSWAMYELADKPKVWAKLRREVLDRIGPSTRPTTTHSKTLSTFATFLMRHSAYTQPCP